MSSSVIVRCPRCNGKGIVYTRVHNGVPIPAQPDAGVCWKCLGAKVIEQKLPGNMGDKISSFLDKHKLCTPDEVFTWDYHVDVYVDKYIVRFSKFKKDMWIAPRYKSPAATGK